MGINGIGFSELLVILAIVLLLFGTQRLGRVGKDLGEAVRGFRNAMSEDQPTPVAKEARSDATQPGQPPTDKTAH